MSQWNGSARPDFAIAPGPAQESVWDYPRPPRLARDAREVIVRAGEIFVARTRAAVRVLETSHPPTFYLPRADVEMAHLARATGGSHCEWKGNAVYFDVAGNARAGWSYEQPLPGFEDLTGHIAFYCDRLVCTVNGVRAVPQAGGFYGGWITPELVGPFKGGADSRNW